MYICYQRRRVKIAKDPRLIAKKMKKSQISPRWLMRFVSGMNDRGRICVCFACFGICSDQMLVLKPPKHLAILLDLCGRIRNKKVLRNFRNLSCNFCKIGLFEHENSFKSP